VAKIKNKYHHSDDPEQLKFWAEELEFIGRPYKLDLSRGVVVAYALPPQKKKKKKHEKETRNKRAESAARHN